MRAFSTPACPRCGYRHLNNRKLLESWICRDCGTVTPYGKMTPPAPKPASPPIANDAYKVAGPTYRHAIARSILEANERARK